MPSGSKLPAPGDKSIPSLLQAARDGSLSQLGELLERTRRYLLLVANRSLDANLRHKQAASDLVQETFLEARKNFAQFRGESEAELFAWLCRILDNKGRDTTRRFRLAAMRDVGREQSLNDSLAPLAQELADHGHSPRALAAVREETAELEAAIAQLTDDEQKVIQLRSFERLPFTEVGLRLARSPDAARKLWVRAVARLQKELVDADESSGP